MAPCRHATCTACGPPRAGTPIRHVHRLRLRQPQGSPQGYRIPVPWRAARNEGSVSRSSSGRRRAACSWDGQRRRSASRSVAAGSRRVPSGDAGPVLRRSRPCSCDPVWPRAWSRRRHVAARLGLCGDHARVGLREPRDGEATEWIRALTSGQQDDLITSSTDHPFGPLPEGRPGGAFRTAGGGTPRRGRAACPRPPNGDGQAESGSTSGGLPA